MDLVEISFVLEFDLVSLSRLNELSKLLLALKKVTPDFPGV